MKFTKAYFVTLVELQGSKPVTWHPQRPNLHLPDERNLSTEFGIKNQFFWQRHCIYSPKGPLRRLTTFQLTLGHFPRVPQIFFSVQFGLQSMLIVSQQLFQQKHANSLACCCQTDRRYNIFVVSRSKCLVFLRHYPLAFCGVGRQSQSRLLPARYRLKDFLTVLTTVFITEICGKIRSISTLLATSRFSLIRVHFRRVKARGCRRWRYKLQRTSGFGNKQPSEFNKQLK